MPPVVGVLKFTAAVLALLQMVWFDTVFTRGEGVTVIVNVVAVPVQVVPPLL